jgi:hypothetical protein
MCAQGMNLLKVKHKWINKYLMNQVTVNGKVQGRIKLLFFLPEAEIMLESGKMILNQNGIKSMSCMKIPWQASVNGSQQI